MTDETPEPKPHLIRGAISSVDWGLWRQHPVSRLFFEMLGAKREIVKTTLLEGFLAGSIGLETDRGQCLRGQLIELQELEDLSFDILAAFFDEGADDGRGGAGSAGGDGT